MVEPDILMCLHLIGGARTREIKQFSVQEKWRCYTRQGGEHTVCTAGDRCSHSRRNSSTCVRVRSFCKPQGLQKIMESLYSFRILGQIALSYGGQGANDHMPAIF
jgi:hypothetical protein